MTIQDYKAHLQDIRMHPDDKITTNEELCDIIVKSVIEYTREEPNWERAMDYAFNAGIHPLDAKEEGDDFYLLARFNPGTFKCFKGNILTVDYCTMYNSLTICMQLPLDGAKCNGKRFDQYYNHLLAYDECYESAVISGNTLRGVNCYQTIELKTDMAINNCLTSRKVMQGVRAFLGCYLDGKKFNEHVIKPYAHYAPDSKDGGQDD